MSVLRLGITASIGGISATFSRNNVMNLIHGPILVSYNKLRRRIDLITNNDILLIKNVSLIKNYSYDKYNDSESDHYLIKNSFKLVNLILLTRLTSN